MCPNHWHIRMSMCSFFWDFQEVHTSVRGRCDWVVSAEFERAKLASALSPTTIPQLNFKLHNLEGYSSLLNLRHCLGDSPFCTMPHLTKKQKTNGASPTPIVFHMMGQKPDVRFKLSINTKPMCIQQYSKCTRGSS